MNVTGCGNCDSTLPSFFMQARDKLAAEVAKLERRVNELRQVTQAVSLRARPTALLCPHTRLLARYQHSAVLWVGEQASQDLAHAENRLQEAGRQADLMVSYVEQSIIAEQAMHRARGGGAISTVRYTL